MIEQILSVASRAHRNPQTRSVKPESTLDVLSDSTKRQGDSTLGEGNRMSGSLAAVQNGLKQHSNDSALFDFPPSRLEIGNDLPTIKQDITLASTFTPDTPTPHEASEPKLDRKRILKLSGRKETMQLHSNGDETKEIHRVTVLTNGIKEKNEMSFVGKYRKIIITLLLIFTFCMTGFGSYLFRMFLRIPGLNDEVDELTSEVKVLTKTVNRLGFEIDRLHEEIKLLENNNNDLEKHLSDLAYENNVVQDLLIQFNTSSIEFKKVNAQLAEESALYEGYAISLNETVVELLDNIISITSSRDILNSTVLNSKTVNEDLQSHVETLSEENENLNDTVKALIETLRNFEDENKYFRELSGNLSVVVDFFRNANEGILNSNDALVSYLSETIISKRTLARVSVRHRMNAEFASWECGFQIAFQSTTFMQDVSLSIGSTSYKAVVNYINSKIFSDLCISVTNFEGFLRSKILSEGEELYDIRTNELTRGVNDYASKVLDYYFSDLGSRGGLEDSDWDSANYECNNLPVDKKFVFEVLQ